MKTNNKKGAKLLGERIEEKEGHKVIIKVNLDFENEIVYYLGKVITTLYALKFIDSRAGKEIPKIKKFYDKHEEAASTLKKVLDKGDLKCVKL